MLRVRAQRYTAGTYRLVKDTIVQRASFPSIATALGFAIATVVGAGGAVDGADMAQAHRPAPGFAIVDAREQRLTLQNFAHKPLVINVFASWCPPCREELPRLVSAARAGQGHVAFLGVDEQEPVEIGARFARAMKIPYPVGFDSGQFAASYGAQSLPETIFIGADGAVSAIHHGTISAAELKRRIAAIR